MESYYVTQDSLKLLNWNGPLSLACCVAERSTTLSFSLLPFSLPSPFPSLFPLLLHVFSLLPLSLYLLPPRSLTSLWHCAAQASLKLVIFLSVFWAMGLQVCTTCLFFLYNVLFWFWCQSNTDFLEWIIEDSLGFWKSLKRISAVSLNVEFSHETTRSRDFLCWKSFWFLSSYNYILIALFLCGIVLVAFMFLGLIVSSRYFYNYFRWKGRWPFTLYLGQWIDSLSLSSNIFEVTPPFPE